MAPHNSSEVVQLAERFAVNEVVAGSNPALRAVLRGKPSHSLWAVSQFLNYLILSKVGVGGKCHAMLLTK